MEELIERLDIWLRKNRPDYYSYLLPGLSNKEIISLEKQLKVELPEDFKLFYMWKNGQPINGIPKSGYSSLIPGQSWLCANWIIKSSKDWQEVIAQNDFGAYWWRPSWITFLSESHSLDYCLDIEGCFDGKKGQVLAMYNDNSLRQIMHESFYKWLETVVIFLENGLFTGDDGDKHLDESEEYLELLKHNNPGYPIEIDVLELDYPNK